MNEIEETREKRGHAHIRALSALTEFRQALVALGTGHDADETRKVFLYQLGFCASCGGDAMNSKGEREICHCTNDE